MMKIREIVASDFAEWLVLWDENNMGVRDIDVSAQTWARLLDNDAQVYGLVAEDRGEIKGLVHYVVHPTTGHLKDVCYMQDLYVAPQFREQGVARAMVEYLAKYGRNKWARMYWLADANNMAAQALYKSLGKRLNFTLHMMAL